MAHGLYPYQFSEPEGRPAKPFQRRVSGGSKIPNSLDWAVWRLLTSERIRVSLTELARDWSYQDFRDAHEALDVIAEAEERARREAENR